MHTHLRIARPVSNLDRSVQQYKVGLSLEQIGSFDEHDGFAGVMLGKTGEPFHFEFTFCRAHPVKPSPTVEDLLVFYVPDNGDWQECCRRMQQAGFVEVPPFNPYWSQRGRSFRDNDGYIVVIQQSSWSAAQ